MPNGTGGFSRCSVGAVSGALAQPATTEQAAQLQMSDRTTMSAAETTRTIGFNAA
jgi:hypothetical protein